jgi:hypothetical protein
VKPNGSGDGERMTAFCQAPDVLAAVRHSHRDWCEKIEASAPKTRRGL